MDKNRRFESGLWIPAAFCFVLTMLGAFLPAGGMGPVLCFLPMCFVFVAMENLALHRRIAALEARAGATDAARSGHDSTP